MCLFSKQTAQILRQSAAVYGAVGKLGQQVPDAQLQLLLAALTDKVHMADPQALSNSLWAAAKMGQQVHDSKYVQPLFAAFVSKLSRAGRTPGNLKHPVGCI